MAQGSRPDRVAEEIRHALSDLLTREVHDPGIGFLTITRVKVSPDLQVARAYYTTMGDPKARAATKAALERAKPFLRRQIGARVRLRRVPELAFHFDEGITHQARVEELILEIHKEREAHPYQGEDGPAGSHQLPDASHQSPVASPPSPVTSQQAPVTGEQSPVASRQSDAGADLQGRPDDEAPGE